MQDAVMHFQCAAALQFGQHHVQPGVQVMTLAEAAVQIVHVGHLQGPVAELGFGNAPPFEQLELEQHFGAITGVALGGLW